MSIIDSIKPFWPLLFTFILPKALGYFQALKTAYRTRPPPKALPPRVDRSLNILFCSIVFFLIQSFPRGPNKDLQNVFATTNTRLGVPTDVLFTRLAMLRRSGVLTATDDALKNFLTTKESRLVYLTHGVSSVLNCSFCHPSQSQTYVLYNLPTTVLLPHIIHLVIIGLATSPSITSPLATRFRSTFVVPSLGLLFLDVFLNTLYNPYPTLIKPNDPSPVSLFTLLRLLRALSICLLDTVFTFYMWTTTTDRFILFPFLSNPDAAGSAPIEELQMRTQELVRNTGVGLSVVQSKLRAYTVAKNTVLRDEGLKAGEARYWDEVRRREGGGEFGDEIYDDEEVQGAIARVYGMGSAGVDIPRARREAGVFVDGVTKGLEDLGG